MRKSHILSIIGILGFLLGLFANFITMPNASAVQIGWQWNSKIQYVQNRTNLFYNQVYAATTDWNTNSHVKPAYSTGTANLIHVDTYDTSVPSGVVAFTRPKSASVECTTYPNIVSSNYCNKTNHQVDFAYVYWNSYYSSDLSTYKDAIARHEMGHAFGLAHVDNNYCQNFSTLMQLHLYCAYQAYNVTLYDSNEISVLYP